MKTIKVIDLLNMIANKEYDKLPKKVKHGFSYYKFNDNVTDYENDDNVYLFDYIVKYAGYSDEVEIIEDTPNKIEKLDTTYLDEMNMNDREIRLARRCNVLMNKLNEIIDYINKNQVEIGSITIHTVQDNNQDNPFMENKVFYSSEGSEK